MRRAPLYSIVFLFAAFSASGHVPQHPSIHDTLAGIVTRLTATLDHDALKNLSLDDVKAFLTEEELHILGTEFWSFTVDVPVAVYVMRHDRQPELPYWLEERGFEKTDLSIVADGKTYEAWRKEFEAGFVGLGINSFERHRNLYFVIVESKERGRPVAITHMYPGRHRTSIATRGKSVYGDDFANIEEVPKQLDGALLLRGIKGRASETQLLRLFRTTPYSATATPDQVVLTWSADPRTTQTIQWRTSPDVHEGKVRYKKADDDAWRYRPATHAELTDPVLVNDPVNSRFTVVLRRLKPATTYVYSVSSGKDGPWSRPSEFTTAPARVVPFSFVYMGDAQNGLDTWGKLLHEAHRVKPHAAFYIMAGDLVNRGIERDDWDSFFHNAKGVFDRRQLVPAIGNHEDQGDKGPWMYLELFDLPKNGPNKIDAERAYSFEYSNALFVILDTNDSIKNQTPWLEKQLARSKATWKFVIYHHPAYSSAPRRDNPGVRKYWGPLFDKYHIDMALQGHDHAYLRTYPMNNEKRVGSSAEGTIYIVSVSGTKFYDQDPREYTEFGMTNVSTYQVLDIHIEGNRLVYRAYDVDGGLRDEVVIEK